MENDRKGMRRFQVWIASPTATVLPRVRNDDILHFQFSIIHSRTARAILHFQFSIFHSPQRGA
ncbi:MAG: hypothetical protein LBT00_05535 [Spirochaetaceae bacterium]|jgi:hypothetical protein|nr:hypothetical protein [Spirochaetaceae bacterium]